MGWSAVASAVTTIGKLLTEEAKYLWGVEEQVDRLQTELKWMQTSLMEAETKQSKDERIRLWVAEIRELAYDAEDVVEEFALKIGSKNKGGLSSCIKRSACFLEEGWVLHETRSKIEKIIERINDLVRRLQAYNVEELKSREKGSSSSTERLESRRPYPHIIDDNIVGLIDDTTELVSILKDERSECSSRVVSIWGMGGLGKTTLVKKIYHHRKIIDYFDHLAFVYVSQQCQTRKVWEDILSCFKKLDRADRGKRDEELAEKLFNILKDKKCLVILDDIWTTEAWDNLKHAFPLTRDSHSKILLTSRNSEIVSYANNRELRCLNNEQSWELFQKIAFPQRDPTENRIDEKMEQLDLPKEKQRMEELRKNVVKHCAGLPLAIIVLGGILAAKNNSSYKQREVSENVKLYLKRGKNRTEDVLALSYDELPPYLRPCFLYLSHFPEDYEIDVDRLIQLWVAEGIVSSEQEERDGGEIEEDVAECYLIELVERCMIQVGERDVATLKVKTIQMHDLMRDVCLSKAKQENFVFIVDQSNASSLSMIRKVRRVSVHKDNLYLPCIQSPNIRSLSFFNKFFSKRGLEEMWNPLNWIRLILGGCCCHCKAQDWIYIFDNFKLLRVLNYEFKRDILAGWKLPSDIGNLIHLRFLSPRGLLFAALELPSSLGNLRCLQTLDLRVDNGRTHVPNVIWSMKQLRHLYLPEKCSHKTKVKLGTLKNLQTLVNFNTKNCYVKDLINMKNLRKLVISGGGNFNEQELGENIMPTLEKLPNIRILEYKRCFEGKKMVCSAQGFRRLESLRLEMLYRLEKWKVDEGAMHSLQRLEIRNCRRLKKLPEGLRFITTLKELKMESMPTEFDGRVEEGGEDFYKVKHVPCIIFQD